MAKDNTLRGIFHKYGLSYSEVADGDKLISSYVSMGIPEFGMALDQIIDHIIGKMPKETPVKARQTGFKSLIALGRNKYRAEVIKILEDMR